MRFLWSWSSRRVQSAVLGIPQAVPRCQGSALPFRERVYLRTFSDPRFHRHAPSRTQPRHSSGGLLKTDKCRDAASCKLAAQRRRPQVDTTPVLAQDDPCPCPAPI